MQGPSDRPARGRGTYMPPHMRSAGHASAAAAARTLEELAPQSIKIKVEFTQGSPFSFELCPDNFEEHTSAQDPLGEQQQATTTPVQGGQSLPVQQDATETQCAAAAGGDNDGGASDTSAVAAAAVADHAGAPPSESQQPAEAGSSEAAEHTAAASVLSGQAAASDVHSRKSGSDAARPRKKAIVECRYLSSPACPDTYHIKQLLRWFKEACRETSEDFPKGDTRAVLSLPASLSKRERAMWHQEADRLALNSQSTGFGEERFLQIKPSGNYHKSSSWSWNKTQGQHTSSATSSSSYSRHGQPPGARPHITLAGDAADDEPPHMDEAATSQAAGAAAVTDSRDGGTAEHGDAGLHLHLQQQQQQHNDEEEGHHPAHQQQQQQPERRQQWAQQGGGSSGGGGGGGGSGGRGGGGGRRAPDLAKQLWDWCQLEGGALWNYSQGEIKEALAAVSGDADKLPPQLAAVVAKRRVSLRLAAVLQSRDETAACQLLTECEPTTRLGWVRDPDSGGYPAHIAAWHGLGAFLQQLVERDGVEVLQQHDAARATPIQLARQRGHEQLAATLEALQVQARGSSSSTPDGPAGTTGRGFVSAQAGATAAAAAGDNTTADSPGTHVSHPPPPAVGPAAVDGPVCGPSAGAGRGFSGRGFGRGRGRGSAAAATPTVEAAEAAGLSSTATDVSAEAAGPSTAAPPAPTTDSSMQEGSSRAQHTCSSSGAADEPPQQQQQQQQQQEGQGKEGEDKEAGGQAAAAAGGQTAEAGMDTCGAAAAAAAAAAPAAAAAAVSDHYCSYASRDDRAYTLYGRSGGGGSRGHRGGGGGYNRGRGGRGGGGGGRWHSKGGWQGRGHHHGGRYGGGRGRSSDSGGEAGAGGPGERSSQAEHAD